MPGRGRSTQGLKALGLAVCCIACRAHAPSPAKARDTAWVAAIQDQHRLYELAREPKGDFEVRLAAGRQLTDQSFLRRLADEHGPSSIRGVEYLAEPGHTQRAGAG